MIIKIVKQIDVFRGILMSFQCLLRECKHLTYYILRPLEKVTILILGTGYCGTSFYALFFLRSLILSELFKEDIRTL